jgi:hypothetical protein
MGEESLSGARPPQGVIEREIGDRSEWLEWRRSNVNASEAACLWGDDIHPYLSAYRLWALKLGKLDGAVENKAMTRGRLLELPAIELMGMEHPAWHVWRPGRYYHHPVWRIGATPDAFMRTYAQGEVIANLQIKTVGRYAFQRHWVDPDTKEVTPPLWIAVQASVETLMTGLEHNFVAAMVISDGGLLDLHLLPIPHRPGILTRLIELARDFWRRVAEGDPYPVDHFKDADAILAVYRDDDGTQIDLSGDERVRDLIGVYGELTAAIREGEAAQRSRDVLKAELIERMGNARAARFGDYVINAPTVNKKAYSVAATSYRRLSIKEA